MLSWMQSTDADIYILSSQDFNVPTGRILLKFWNLERQNWLFFNVQFSLKVRKVTGWNVAQWESTLWFNFQSLPTLKSQVSTSLIRILESYYTLYWGCEIPFPQLEAQISLECGGRFFFPFLISTTQLWHFLPPLPVHLFPTEYCCLKWDVWGFCRCWGTRWNKNASHLLPNYRNAGLGPTQAGTVPAEMDIN